MVAPPTDMPTCWNQNVTRFGKGVFAALPGPTFLQATVPFSRSPHEGPPAASGSSGSALGYLLQAGGRPTARPAHGYGVGVGGTRAQDKLFTPPAAFVEGPGPQSLRERLP